MITNNIEVEIIDKYNNGISINKIAKEFNLDWHKVERILLKNHITIKRQYHI